MSEVEVWDNEMSRLCVTCSHRYGEHTDRDKGPCNELGGECDCMRFVAAPSVDVEKLRELTTRLESVHKGLSRGSDFAHGELWGIVQDLRALLDSTPTVVQPAPELAAADYGPAETQYGVRYPDGCKAVEEGFRTADLARAQAAKENGETVTCEQRRTPWRPVDGAPECDCRHIGSDHNDEGRGLVPCQRCDCPDYSPVDGASGEDSQT